MTDPLERIAAALERMSPPPLEAPDLTASDAFVWHVVPDRLVPVEKVNRIDMGLLLGIDRARDTLLQRPRQLARGLPAHNTMLWCSRRCAKSSTVTAVHTATLASGPPLHRR